MKNKLLTKILPTLLVGGLIISVSSCNKEKKTMSPDPVSDPGNVKTASSTPSQPAGLPPIFLYNPVKGVSATGYIYNVAPRSGTVIASQQMQSDGIPLVNASGIAKSLDPMFPNRYVVSVPYSTFCSTGTAFYNVDPTFSGAPVGTGRLGLLPGRIVKDIEYNPADGKLYGLVGGDSLIQFTSLGVGCRAGVPPVAPTYSVIGRLPVGVSTSSTQVGAGPFSITFNSAGQLYVFSAKEHTRSIVAVPSLTVMSVSWYSGGGLPDMTTPTEIGSCISNGHMLVATLESTPSVYSYYQLNASGGTLPWTFQSNNCLADYTSEP